VDYSKAVKMEAVVDTVSVSVIIPAYTEERLEDIRKAVASVQNQSCPPLEIIIPVDHNKELVDRLRSLYHSDSGIRVTLNDRVIGGAETRNIGILSASGDIVAFLDDDAWAEKHWLKCLLRAYTRDSSVFAVGGRTISVWSGGRPSWFPEELDWLVGGIWKGHREDPGEVRNLIGPNMSFRHEVCETIGYMRTELGAMPGRARAGDETEFYIRLRSMVPGSKVVYEPDALVWHRTYRYKSTVGYLARRSSSDGYWKGKTAPVLKNMHTDAALSTESEYLRYLLLSAIPSRLARFWRWQNITQSAAIIASILCIGVGYLWGRYGWT